MLLTQSTRTALLLSIHVLHATAIALSGYKVCIIPYMTPRIFERQSDPINQVFTEDMSPQHLALNLSLPSSRHTTHHPAQVLATKYLTTHPSIWTAEPWCTFAPSLPSQLCVYTSRTFARGRGISIVAPSEQAAFLARAPALQHALAYEWPPLVNPPAVSARLRVAAVHGKGLGVRAVQRMVRGDAPMGYTPVVAVADAVMQIGSGAGAGKSAGRSANVGRERNLPLAVAVARLPDAARRAFGELAGAFGGDAIYDRVNTNAFSIAIGDSGVFYWAVYPETARFNHDCRPNTMYSSNSNDLVHHLRVSRDISVGEEVTLSYLPPTARSWDRKQKMKDQWGFACTCNLCTAPEHVIRASDQRLDMIDKLEVELNDLGPNRTADTHTADLLVSLYEQERLDGVTGDGYMYAAFEYAYVGNKRLVQKYAALAIEHMAVWRGPLHYYYETMWNLLVQPEQQRSWLYFEKLKDT